MGPNERQEEEKVETVIKNLSDKKAFAREQYAFLKSKGIVSRMRLSRIFKAAGPGQIQEAFKLADSVDWENRDGEPDSDKDMLECLLAGATVVRWGRARMEAVLTELEYYVPPAHNSKCFFRILAGAREIIAPGAHKFSEEAMEEIKEGLQKKIYEDDKEEIVLDLRSKNEER